MGLSGVVATGREGASAGGPAKKTTPGKELSSCLWGAHVQMAPGPAAAMAWSPRGTGGQRGQTQLADVAEEDPECSEFLCEIIMNFYFSIPPKWILCYWLKAPKVVNGTSRPVPCSARVRLLFAFIPHLGMKRSAEGDLSACPLDICAGPGREADLNH